MYTGFFNVKNVFFNTLAEFKSERSSPSSKTTALLIAVPHEQMSIPAKMLHIELSLTLYTWTNMKLYSGNFLSLLQTGCSSRLAALSKNGSRKSIMFQTMDYSQVRKAECLRVYTKTVILANSPSKDITWFLPSRALGSTHKAAPLPIHHSFIVQLITTA